jgi:cyclopropane-fatty-acyl-phospholipid synthase
MSTAVTIPYNARKSFYEKTIIGLLSKMQAGYLRLTMPDGELIHIGNNDADFAANVHINNPEFFKNCLLYGDIGFGESYVAGHWKTDNITNVIKWFLLNVENAPSISGSSVKNITLNILKFINRLYHSKRQNSIDGSKKNIAEHYDLSNDFFSLFLDPTMTYSSAYFINNEKNLQQAQYAKYDRLCKQLHLQPSDHVLEIGSGWGGNAIFMAKNYGCRVTTITISEEQFKFAKQKIEEENLTDKIEILLQDYRTMQGSFDKIVSVEMIEAVGDKFMQAYFSKCNALLKPNGIFALQAITCPDSRYESLRNGVDWIQKHIFPGSLIPSVSAINKAINAVSDFTLVDLKDIGTHYATTLALWREQFNRNIDLLNKQNFDEFFIRKWNYYFSYCEAAFAMRNINCMQLVYVRPNNLLR